MKKLQAKHADIITETNGYLALIFDLIGIAEFSKSSRKKEVYWDVADSGKVDEKNLEKFAATIEKLYHDLQE